MADTVEAPAPTAPTTEQAAQASIEMPNGIVLTGIGGDTEAVQKQFEARAEELTDAQPETQESAKQPADKKPIRKRLGQLTYEREEATRRADAAEARIKELEAKIAAPVAAPVVPQAVAPVAAPVIPAEIPSTRTKPTEDQVGTKYQTYSDFVEDLADWKAEQREARLLSTLDARAKTSIEVERASRNRMDYVNTKVFPAGKAAYQDFDAVLNANTTPTPHIVHEAILALEPEAAAHALYVLSKDQAKLNDVIGLAAQPVKLGIFLAQLMPRASVASPASTAPVVRTTNAPAPPQPVGAGSRTTSPSIEELANKGEYEAYKAARAAQRAS